MTMVRRLYDIWTDPGTAICQSGLSHCPLFNSCIHYMPEGLETSYQGGHVRRVNAVDPGKWVIRSVVFPLEFPLLTAHDLSRSPTSFNHLESGAEGG